MIMIAASQWYTSATALTVLTIALVALAVLALGVTVYQWHAGAPARQITYSMYGPVLLLPQHEITLSKGVLKINYDFEDERGLVSVTDPYLITLRTESKSRRDISSKEFDANKPLVFDLGTRIVARVGESSSEGTDTSYEDAVTIGERTVEINPCLIRNGPIFSLDLLLSGSPDLTHHSPLIDVKVQRVGVQGAYDAFFGWGAGVGWFIAYAILATCVLGASVLYEHTLDRNALYYNQHPFNQYTYESIQKNYEHLRNASISTQSLLHHVVHIESIVVTIFSPILLVGIVVCVLLSRRYARIAERS
jgi:hypothetical protein